jgi:hypothetical protein
MNAGSDVEADIFPGPLFDIGLHGNDIHAFQKILKNSELGDTYGQE